MVQIMLLWNERDPEDRMMVEKLRNGFNKMGCWHAELAPKDSIYKLLLIVERENMKTKEGQNGNKKD